MPRVPYAYLQMPIGWSPLVMPIIVYVRIHLGIGYFKGQGCLETIRSSVWGKIKLKLTQDV